MKYVWTAKYGQQAANQVCTGRVPIAMSGRWGATSKGEEFLLRAVSNNEKSQQFRKVCSVVWTSAKNPQAKAGVATREEKRERLCDGHVDDGDGLAELAVEAMEAETIKRSKWRASSLRAVKDETFIDITVAMLHRSREPLQHFMHWIEQTAKPTEIDGEQRYPGKMALLCWCKAEAFLSELEAAKRAQDIKCVERLAVSKEASSTADEKLDVIARKLKFVYKDQLVFCAANCGACRLELWLLVDLWAKYCPADTQSIESFNNIVTNATVLAPNIKFPLLNALSVMELRAPTLTTSLR